MSRIPVGRLRAAGGLGAALTFILVAASAAWGAPTFLHDGGPVAMRHVRVKARSSTLQLLEGVAQVTCRSGSGTATIAGKTDQHLLTGLRITFRSCFAKNNIDGQTCPVHTVKGAEGAAAKQITTGALRGELVPVAFEEAFTRVGLEIGTEHAGKPFLVFEASASDDCLPVPRTAQRRVPVYGRVIAEVGDVEREVRTDPIHFEVELGAYLETSQRIQHPLSIAQEVLSAFGGLEAPLQSEMTLRFEEGVEISG
jgi:hypothetical protein